MTDTFVIEFFRGWPTVWQPVLTSFCLVNRFLNGQSKKTAPGAGLERNGAYEAHGMAIGRPDGFHQRQSPYGAEWEPAEMGGRSA